MTQRVTEPGSLDREIRALRPPKNPVDPSRPIKVLVESERHADGGVRSWLVAFLAGRECAFTCVFCDLWRNTLDGPTPPGAIPRQLELARSEAGQLPAGSGIKLYNASNFFDEKAVPRADWPAIFDAVRPFETVTVECHPCLIGEPFRDFAGRLDGRLEVAMGLETAHPEALSKLNKRMTIDDFDRAATRLEEEGVGLRVFVLVGAPFVPSDETVDWTVRSVEHALAAGARVVSLIPIRLGRPYEGYIATIARHGGAAPVTLGAVERAFERSLRLGKGVILLDLWDVQELAECRRCAEARIARLTRMNLTGGPEPKVDCDLCGGR